MTIQAQDASQDASQAGQAAYGDAGAAAAAAEAGAASPAYNGETDAQMAARLQAQYGAPVAVATEYKQPIPTVSAVPESMNASSGGYPGQYAPQTAMPNPHDGVYAIPMQYGTHPSTLPTQHVFVDTHAQKLLAAWHLGRGMRTLSIIDGFFVILNSLTMSPAFMIFVIGPLAGYRAGKNFNKAASSVYFGTYVVRMMIDLVIASAYPNFFTMITLFIDMFILSFVWRFTRMLGSLTQEEIAQLQNNLEGVDFGQGDMRSPGAARVIFVRGP